MERSHVSLECILNNKYGNVSLFSASAIKANIPPHYNHCLNWHVPADSENSSSWNHFPTALRSLRAGSRAASSAHLSRDFDSFPLFLNVHSGAAFSQRQVTRMQQLWSMHHLQRQPQNRLASSYNPQDINSELMLLELQKNAGMTWLETLLGAIVGETLSIRVRRFENFIKTALQTCHLNSG